MNCDVNDLEKGLEETAVANNESSNQRKSHILARIRNFNNAAMSSISSALSGHFSAMGSFAFQDEYTTPSMNHNYGVWNGVYDLEATSTTGNFSYDRKQQFHAVDTLSSTKAGYSSPSSTPSQMRTSVVPTPESISSNSYQTDQPLQNVSRSHPPAVYSWDDFSGTPPLTPDSFEFSPAVPSGFDHDDNDGMEGWSQSYLPEIKAGKKPERMNSYDALASGLDSNSIVNEESEATQSNNVGAATDDKDEWYGLEYTLELSCRERHPSESSKSGEHSRSRESWAAIHQGTIHPFYEEDDYNRWKNWHRYLDREEERLRHKRSHDFNEFSEDLAWLYADEMRTRDIIRWQKEVYGFVSRDCKEHLETLAEYRPDPYLSSKEHNLGWYLKRSRSVACLLELRPLPTMNNGTDAGEHSGAYFDDECASIL